MSLNIAVCEENMSVGDALAWIRSACDEHCVVENFSSAEKVFSDGKFYDVYIFSPEQRGGRGKLVVKKGYDSRVIALRDIISAKSGGKKVIVNTASESIEFTGKLSEIAQLPGFFRPHRSFVVNIDHVQSYSSRHIKLSNGEQIIMARSKFAELKKEFNRRESAT